MTEHDMHGSKEGPTDKIQTLQTYMSETIKTEIWVMVKVVHVNSLWLGIGDSELTKWVHTRPSLRGYNCMPLTHRP